MKSFNHCLVKQSKRAVCIGYGGEIFVDTLYFLSRLKRNVQFYTQKATFYYLIIVCNILNWGFFLSIKVRNCILNSMNFWSGFCLPKKIQAVAETRFYSSVYNVHIVQLSSKITIPRIFLVRYRKILLKLKFQNQKFFWIQNQHFILYSGKTQI